MLERSDRYALLSTAWEPYRLMATIDFKQRGFRSGHSTTGRFVDEKTTRIGTTKRKKYEGRGWRQALVDDAAAYLREALR